VILASADAGAWIAGGFALAAGVVAGGVQLRSVQKQQQTTQTANVITGYDKLVEDLHTEIKTAREEAREARVEASVARKEALDVTHLFRECETRSHNMALELAQVRTELDVLRNRMNDIHGPLKPKSIDNPHLWEEGENPHE
jgi:chromosome segregation ATPase